MVERKNRSLIRHLAEALAGGLSNWSTQEPPDDGKQAAFAEARVSGRASGNRDIFSSINTDVATKIREVESWVMLAVDVIGKKLSQLPILVGTMEPNENGVEVFFPDADTDYAELLRRPNPWFAMNDLSNWLIQSALLTGEGFLEIILDESGRPTQIWPLVSSHVKKQVNGMGELTEYKYSVHGIDQFIPVDRIIEFKEINIANPYQGFTAIQPLREVILNQLQLRTFTRRFMENGAIPGGILSTEHKNLPEPVKEKIRDEWFDQHGTPNNAGRMAILHAGVTYQQIQVDMDKIGIENIRKMNRDEILAALQIPPIYGGVFDKANYANSREQKILLWEFLIPRKIGLEQSINRHLGDKYFEGMRAICDTSGIDVLKPERRETAAVGISAWNAGLITLNETRTRFLSIEPVDDDELGDTFKAEPSADLFLDEPTLAETPPEKTDDDDDADDDAKSFQKIMQTLSARVNGSRPDRLLNSKERVEKVKMAKRRKSHLRFLNSLERINRRDVNKFFNQQKKRLLKQVAGLAKSGAWRTEIVQEIYRMEKMNPIQFKQDVPKPDEISLLFDIELETAEIEAMTTRYANRSVQTGGRRAIADIGLEVGFDAQTAAAQELVAKAKNFSTRINNTTFASIRGLLERANREDMTVNELSKEIRQLYDGWTGSLAGEAAIPRSRRIALTETTRLINGAAKEAWKQNDITHKRWLTIIDGETREEHIAADFEKVGIDESFVQTGEALDVPGDSAGSAWNVINCRCGMVGELADDEVSSRNYGDICKRCHGVIIELDLQPSTM